MKCCMCEKDLTGKTSIPVRKYGSVTEYLYLCSNRCWRVYELLRGRRNGQ